MQKNFIIDGIPFSNEEEAKKAEKESEGIQYIKQKNDMKNPMVLLALYNKFTERNIFQTKVGLEFLKEIKQELIKNPQIKNEEIFGCKEEEKKELEKRKREEFKKKEKTEIEKKREIANKKEVINKKEKIRKEEQKYKYRYYNSLLLNIILIISIILMGVITLKSKNHIISNCKTEFLDEYSSWENELRQKENELKQREKELEEKILNQK